jgi:hypothetical protein
MECKTCAHYGFFGFCQLTKQWVPPTHGCNAHTKKDKEE